MRSESNELLDADIVSFRWEGWMMKKSRGLFPRWQRRYVKISHNSVAILRKPSDNFARRYIVRSSTAKGSESSEITISSMVICFVSQFTTCEAVHNGQQFVQGGDIIQLRCCSTLVRDAWMSSMLMMVQATKPISSISSFVDAAHRQSIFVHNVV